MRDDRQTLLANAENQLNFVLSQDEETTSLNKIPTSREGGMTHFQMCQFLLYPEVLRPLAFGGFALLLQGPRIICGIKTEKAKKDKD